MTLSSTTCLSSGRSRSASSSSCFSSSIGVVFAVSDSGISSSFTGVVSFWSLELIESFEVAGDVGDSGTSAVSTTIGCISSDVMVVEFVLVDEREDIAVCACCYPVPR
ncbi:unnamed protein product [Ambrosiozyma monospora]|uniref:Unnamed protein product n=1 Tax=Ambrosiozyma monospora TaxID=43982 RepID=A0ACB5UCM2_AMBMO|nr:unnamed protein product [Ambrosiozyma monospora]